MTTVWETCKKANSQSLIEYWKKVNENLPRSAKSKVADWVSTVKSAKLRVRLRAATLIRGKWK